jgi:hypothetical protein
MSLKHLAIRTGLTASSLALVATIVPVDASHRTPEDPTCRCSARLSLARPALQFNGDTLQFIPRVNISITSRGDSSAPGWTARVAHSGQTSYTSDDVSVPSGVTFSGDQQVFAGSCGNKFSFSGYQLPAVTLSGISRTLVGDDQELEGIVRMQADLTGCDSDSENRQFEFRVREFGNLRVGGWRTAR